ncbi:MAG: hypothetical protein M0Q46_04215 [Endomicrobiales bacterium]|nr:hypothetical protein [Endomicrobiales bacterium]
MKVIRMLATLNTQMKIFIRITFIILIFTSLFSGVTFCATGFSGDALDVSYCPGNQFPPLAIIDEIANDLTDDYSEFKRQNAESLYFYLSPKEILRFLLIPNFYTLNLFIPESIPRPKIIPLSRDSLVL